MDRPTIERSITDNRSNLHELKESLSDSIEDERVVKEHIEDALENLDNALNELE